LEDVRQRWDDHLTATAVTRTQCFWFSALRLFSMNHRQFPLVSMGVDAFHRDGVAPFVALDRILILFSAGAKKN
jgi:hypothetical protein